MKVVKRNYYTAEGNLIIKPYQLQHLAEIYEVHPKTLRRWIDKLVPQIGKKKEMLYVDFLQALTIRGFLLWRLLFLW